MARFASRRIRFPRARTREDTPVTRIAKAWPTPEPSRAAALRDLTMIATYPPIVAREENVTDRSDFPKSGNRFSNRTLRKKISRRTRRNPPHAGRDRNPVARRVERKSRAGGHRLRPRNRHPAGTGQRRSNRPAGRPRQYRRGRHDRECEDPRRQGRPGGEKESAAGHGDEKGARGPAPPEARTLAG